MVRHNQRSYSKSEVEDVLTEIARREPVEMDDIVFKLGPQIAEQTEAAVETLVENGVIGSQKAFLKSRLDFTPWDTIIYDGIDDGYIGVKSNNSLYLRDHTYDKFDVKMQCTNAD